MNSEEVRIKGNPNPIDESANTHHIFGIGVETN